MPLQPVKASTDEETFNPAHQNRNMPATAAFLSKCSNLSFVGWCVQLNTSSNAFELEGLTHCQRDPLVMRLSIVGRRPLQHLHLEVTCKDIIIHNGHVSAHTHACTQLPTYLHICVHAVLYIYGHVVLYDKRWTYYIHR